VRACGGIKCVLRVAWATRYGNVNDKTSKQQGRSERPK
jgi:hypothetical protein